MKATPIHVMRMPVRLTPDPRRTLTRFFWPGEERAKKIMHRILRLSPAEVSGLLNDLLMQFSPDNPALEECLMEHCEMAVEKTGVAFADDPNLRMLVGAYFSMEYAFESAALFNPSMVEAPDQSMTPEGSLAFVMSLRAVGEGHLSSIVFRRGMIDAAGNIRIKPTTLEVRAFKRAKGHMFEKAAARARIDGLAGAHPLLDEIFNDLPERFSYAVLEQKLERLEQESGDKGSFDRIEGLVRMMAESEYEIPINRSFTLEDMVLFPMSATESRGMEDMRAVRFVDDDGTRRLLGTYTAYNGREIVPQVLEVPQQGSAKVHMMWGECARNKGMAFFPKRIGGQYAVIGRIDGENLFLLKSDSITRWDHAKLIMEPTYDWEFMQIGNCGPPLETPEGWLLLTHGVGPMRKYCIGAVLLDLEDPSKVVARLKSPLMSPIGDERTGYVPNVVYSCGALIHRDMLVIPYGISDMDTGFAIVDLPELLDHMR